MHFLMLLPALLAATVSSLALPSLIERASSSVLTIALPSCSLPPAPPTNTVLKYVGLGCGTQNYTCATSSSTATPASNGAKATLYNAGSYLQAQSEMIQALPPLALGMEAVSGGRINLADILSLPVLGEHYFNSALQPTFDLYAVNAQLLAKKAGDIPAPSDACPGPDDAGAVDWLYLIDGSDGDGATFGGVSAVYRVETAGGSAPKTCENSPASIEVPYCAEYWYYG